MSEDLSKQNPPTGDDKTTGDLRNSAGDETPADNRKPLEYAKPGTTPAEAPFVIALPDESTSSDDWYLWAGVLALLALVAFWPAIWGNFLFDDDRHLAANAAIQTMAGFWHCWIPASTPFVGTPGQSTQMVGYAPLTYALLHIEWVLWKSIPLRFHIVDLALHALAAIVTWRALRRLALPGAWVAAALWAVHPLQAESVNWISQTGLVLSGLLLMSSLLFFLEFAGLDDPAKPILRFKLSDRSHAYALSLILFLLAILSWPAVGLFPLALLLILWWKEKASQKMVMALLPMFALGIIVLCCWAYQENGMIARDGEIPAISIVQRILLVGHAAGFYAIKLIVPASLIFNYPNPPAWENIAGWAMLLIVIGGLFASVKKWGRGPLVAMLCYLALILPVSGIIPLYSFRYAYVADHLQYLAGLPLIVLVVSALGALAKHLANRASKSPQNSPPRPRTQWAALAAAALVMVVGGVAWVRSNLFTDQNFLWRDTLAKNPNSWLAGSTLAEVRLRAADADLVNGAEAERQKDSVTEESSIKDAMAQLTDSERLLNDVEKNPDTPNTILYEAYEVEGSDHMLWMQFPQQDIDLHLAAAKEYFTKSIEIEQRRQAEHPDARPFLNMGTAQVREAALLARKLGVGAPGVAYSPPTSQAGGLPAMPTTRPQTDAETKVVADYETARGYFQQAVAAANAEANIPEFVTDARRKFALAAASTGDIDLFLASLAISRHDLTGTEYYNKLGADDYNQSLLADPFNPDVQYHMGLCLEALGYFTDAEQHYILAIKYTPENKNPLAMNAAGIIKAKYAKNYNDVQAAIASFQSALAIDPGYTQARQNLAMAQALLKSGKLSTQPATAPAQ
jgi:tetratricopeptide (TPR) repeat protein